MTAPRDRTLALAAVFQAAALVDDAAHGRPLDDRHLTVLLEAVLIVDAQAIQDIYGPPAQLRLGLTALTSHLTPGLGSGSGAAPGADILRYVFSLLRLAHQFQRAPALRGEMDKRLERLKAQRAHFAVTHETLLEAFADAYSATLATLPRRIEVRGQRGALTQARTAALIRACLLAGARAAILFFQLGGRRRQLFFQRRAVLGAAQALREELP